MTYPIIQTLGSHFVGYLAHNSNCSELSESRRKLAQHNILSYAEMVGEPCRLHHFSAHKGCLLSVNDKFAVENNPRNLPLSESKIDVAVHGCNDVFCYMLGTVYDYAGQPLSILEILQQAIPIKQKNTNSTEVMAIIKEVLSTIYGDFSLVAYLPATNCLLIAVSPGGACWMYYRNDDTHFHFATHPALLVPNPKNIQLDEGFFVSSLKAYPIGGKTPYHGVFRLRPGHAVLTSSEVHGISYKTSSSNDTIQAFRWWTIPQQDPRGGKTTRDYIDSLRTLLGETMHRRINQYQKVYISLSAGIDSGAIAVSAKSLYSHNPHFTLGSVSYCTQDVPQSNEYPYAADIANRLGLDNIAVYSNTEYWRLDALLRLSEGMAFPTEHILLAPIQYQLGKAVAGQTDAILLTGAGGELFLGGLSYLGALLKKKKLVRFARESALWCFRGYSLSRIARDTVSGWRMMNERKYGANSSPLHPQSPNNTAPNLQFNEMTDFSLHPMLHDMESFLLDELLGAETLDPTVYGAMGVTTSSPFLDRKLLEFALSIDLEQRIDLSRERLGKPLLRAAFPEIPRDISLKAARLFLEEYIAYAWIKNARHNRFDELMDNCEPYIGGIINIPVLASRLACMRHPAEIKEVAGAVSCLIWLQAQMNAGLCFAKN